MTIIVYHEDEIRHHKGQRRKKDLEAHTEAERDQLQKNNSLIPLREWPAEIHDHFNLPLS